MPVSADDLELKIPPIQSTLEIKGQPVRITSWGAVSRAPQGGFRLALTADLAEVQANLSALLASELNRDDRCGEHLAVQSAGIAPASPAAILTVQVHYERWACIKALGRNAAKRLVGGNATVLVKVTPAAGAEGIAMTAEVQKIEADGSLGQVLESGSFGPAIKEKIAHSIESSVRKALDLKSALPPQVAAAVTLRSAQFANGAENHLWFKVDGDARITAAQFQALAGKR